MFGKLLPKEPLFFDLFEEHAQVTRKAAETFLKAIIDGPIDLQNGINPIKVLEHQADEITHHCIEALRKSFITPLQQDDIFRLISRMDDIIDGINEAFEDCLIYKIASFTPNSREFAQLLVLATERVEFLVKGLRNRKQQAEQMREAILQIHELENQADEVLRRALGQLFEDEQDLRLLIKWKEIYEVLERSMDFCEDVSNIVEGIILEYD